MTSSILAALLLCVAATGTQAALKNLGDVCAAADSCLHASLLLTCDNLVCRIKQGQACSADGYSTMCVAGAECVGGSCTCKAPHYTADAASGQCTAAALKWGWGPCTSGNEGTECPAASDLTCTASNPCTCATNTYVDLSTGVCAEIATIQTIGYPCGTTPTVRRKRAADTTKCGVATAIECTSDFCACVDGYTGPPGGTCAEVPAMKVGKKCVVANVATDCGTDTNMECTGSPLLCACKTGFTGVTGGTCSVAAGELNGPCTATADCTSSEANDVCAGDTADSKKCVCKAGYSLNAAGDACDVTPNTIGGSCTGGPALKGSCADVNGICSQAAAGTCSCKTAYSVPAGSMTCKANLKIGGTCAGSDNTQGDCEDANAFCTSLVCLCKPGYTGVEGGTCTKVADNVVGGACTGSGKGTCSDPVGVCTASICGCPSQGYIPNIGGACTKIADNTFGGACTGTGSSGTCTDTNAECTTLFCTCTAPYMGILGQGCAAVNADGGSCTALVANTKGSCTSANAKCSAQTGGTCVVPGSGAAATLASLTLLLAAFVGVMTLV